MGYNICKVWSILFLKTKFIPFHGLNVYKKYVYEKIKQKLAYTVFVHNFKLHIGSETVLQKKECYK